MFIPKVGRRDPVKNGRRRNRRRRTHVDSATYLAYAPIRSIHSSDGKSFWSVGISMPEREITQLADDIHNKLVAVLEVVLALFAALTAVVVFAAMRMSKGITRPIRGA